MSADVRGKASGVRGHAQMEFTPAAPIASRFTIHA
jgi:hypothetical protein